MNTIKNFETFTCDDCGKTYPKGWKDEEATKEAKKKYQGIIFKPENFGVVCDECYKKY